MEPGVFEPGRDADARARVVPRLRLAGGRAAAAARLRRALRVGLLDPAPARRRARSTARRASARTPPICTPGPRSTCPGAGWIGLDATSGLLAGEGHIPLACTAMPATRGADLRARIRRRARRRSSRIGEEFTFEMRVRRIDETPRVTKPYRDDQWKAIQALGRQVDRDLERLDVRLTMGGEPTFVSIDDRDAPEWNIAALGAGKRAVADRLLRRLRTRFAPGGVLHHGQGKWYPGEPLPRWAFSCYFRRDGEPIWREPALFAKDVPTRAADGAAASAFIQALARRLSVEPDNVLPAYEDVYYYLWRERRLPPNVDVLDNKLDDETERARLARVFARRAGRDRRLRAAAARARVGQRRRSGRRRVGEQRLVAARRRAVSAARRFAPRLPAAARQPAVGDQGGAELDLRARSAARPPAAHARHPADTAGAAAQRARQRRRPRRRARRPGPQRSIAPMPASSAPRCAWRSARASCTCSCRRSGFSRSFWR